MLIKIAEQPFDPLRELQDYQDRNAGMSGKYGATSIFIGTMRDFNDGDVVSGMLLEYYPGMTEKCIAEAVGEAQERWSILECLVVHRVGEVYPNQPIVLVSVWTGHRGDAFDACRFIMETLKSTAPFWKKEIIDSNNVEGGEKDSFEPMRGERWVTGNSNGYARNNNG